jgi:hypothetical protein
MLFHLKKHIAMKKLLSNLACMGAFMLLIYNAYAQRPYDGKPGGDHRGGGRHGHWGGREGMALQKLSDFKGTLVEFTYNEDKAADGFLLNGSSADGKNLKVHFHPRLAKEVMDAAKKGSAVTVTGMIRKNREGEEIVIFNKMIAGSRTVYSQPFNDRREEKEKDEFTTLNGKITALSKDQSGKTNGFYLDKTLVRFSPYVAFQLGDKLAVGKEVGVTGMLRSEKDGEVWLEKNRIIRAHTLVLEGITYAVR